MAEQGPVLRYRLPTWTMVQLRTRGPNTVTTFRGRIRSFQDWTEARQISTSPIILCTASRGIFQRLSRSTATPLQKECWQTGDSAEFSRFAPARFQRHFADRQSEHRQPDIGRYRRRTTAGLPCAAGMLGQCDQSGKCNQLHQDAVSLSLLQES